VEGREPLAPLAKGAPAEDALRHGGDDMGSCHQVKRILLLWAFNAVALIVADWIVDGIRFDDEWVVIPAGAVFGIVNWLVKPIVTLLSLPVIILTLGIALFFVNLLMLYLTSWIVPGFSIDSFWSAVGATIVVWLVNTVLQAVFGVEDMRRRRTAEAR
jgi:putative membrane protein